MILATASGLDVVVHHVDHGHRAETARNADRASEIAERLGVEFVLHHARMVEGPNFEAAARHARRQLLPDGALMGHTADDLAETVLYRLIRGSGPDGLAAIRPGPTHPILALRRSDTERVCADAGIEPVRDSTNDDPRHVRNRIRHELVPLANSIADRDVVPLLARTATLASEQRELLDELVADVDPTDARVVATLPDVLARRVLRRWLASVHPDHYPPDQAGLARVLAVARGESTSCELRGGLRVGRSGQRLSVVINPR